LEVSEKDVKDASAGVMQDLRRFQKDKEGDLRRYMVGTSLAPTSCRQLTGIAFRSHMHAAIWIGLARTSKLGQKLMTKLTRSLRARHSISTPNPHGVDGVRFLSYVAESI
jgi:hypothetical protein